jgi:hypothetical protein
LSFATPITPAGWCTISSSLPLPETIETEISLSPNNGDAGVNSVFNDSVHCAAAEPHTVFIRVGVVDGGQEVSYETLPLGRLRRGYRVFQMRGMLGSTKPTILKPLAVRIIS